MRAQQLFRRAHAMRLWYKSAGLMLAYIRTLRRQYFAIKGKVAARTINRICRMWPVPPLRLLLTPYQDYHMLC